MSSKIPLILIPGLLCDEALWQHQLHNLGNMADCIVTDKHVQYETIDEIAEAIVNEAPSKFALAGLSMGGYIALEICRRFGDRIEKLALLNTSARVDTPERKTRRNQLITLAQQGKFIQAVEIFAAALFHPDRQNDMVLKNEVLEMTRRVGVENFIRQQQAIMKRRNQIPHLSEISCPTIVICGEEDQLIPIENSEEIATHIPGSQFYPIKNCGHMSTMERPEEVTSIMEQWLLSG